jgi:hypothetical protein
MNEVCARLGWPFTSPLCGLIGRSLKMVGRTTQRLSDGTRMVVSTSSSLSNTTVAAVEQCIESEDSSNNNSESADARDSVDVRAKYFVMDVRKLASEKGDSAILGHRVSDVQRLLKWPVKGASYSAVHKYIRGRGWRIEKKTHLIVGTEDEDDDDEDGDEEEEESTHKRKQPDSGVSKSIVANADRMSALYCPKSNLPRAAVVKVLQHAALHGIEAFLSETPTQVVEKMRWFVSSVTTTLATNILRCLGLELDSSGRFVKCVVIAADQLKFIQRDTGDGILRLPLGATDDVRFDNPLGPTMQMVYELTLRLNTLGTQNTRDDRIRAIAKDVQQSYFTVKEWMNLLIAAQGAGVDPKNDNNVKVAFCNSHNVRVWMQGMTRLSSSSSSSSSSSFPTISSLPPANEEAAKRQKVE